jgi:small subunit ribosomal protein S2
VPGNDDALRAIRLFAGKVADAVLAGRGLREAQLAETVAGGPAEPARRPARPVPAPSTPAAPTA